VIHTPDHHTTSKAYEPSAASVDEDFSDPAVTDAWFASDLSALKEVLHLRLPAWNLASVRHLCDGLVNESLEGDDRRTKAIEILTYLNDRRMDTGSKKRSSVLSIVREALSRVFASCPRFNENGAGRYRYLDWATRSSLRSPLDGESVLVVNAHDFPPEGPDCDAMWIRKAREAGWRRFICYGYKGQRFCGCGLTGSDDVRIDVYGCSGDYLASGIDGLEMYVHDSAQDQLGQILKRGKLVIYGDVGQTFMYGAKGGNVYVLGNAAGRPLINAVGRPRVVINGTCLDYLAESFMAGDPLKGGGFVVLNGLEFDDHGHVQDQASPYPGSNLFSLASGGAIYLRDPHHKVVNDQLNGGEFVEMTPEDWNLILPYLTENEALFGISVEDHLLTVDGKNGTYREIYRKVQAVKLDVLAKESQAVEEYDEDWEEE
jgi:glutamate synthase domain-containing protein 3